MDATFSKFLEKLNRKRTLCTILLSVRKKVKWTILRDAEGNLRVLGAPADFDYEALKELPKEEGLQK